MIQTMLRSKSGLAQYEYSPNPGAHSPGAQAPRSKAWSMHGHFTWSVDVHLAVHDIFQVFHMVYEGFYAISLWRVKPGGI